MLIIRSWKAMSIVVGIPVAIGAAIFISLEVTSSPRFCKTCHNMKPYYESWTTSTHNKVSCVKCHIAPGIGTYFRRKYEALAMVALYITGNTPTVYRAQVKDRSCLRAGCHNKTLLSREKIDFSKDITFSHELHFQPLRNEIKLRCTSCHSQIVQGEHITVT
ncbi:MAG: NapC/NirT family cytochrome c, partial [bacterium]